MSSKIHDALPNVWLTLTFFLPFAYYLNNHIGVRAQLGHKMNIKENLMILENIMILESFKIP
jgi:hypothetical protein